MNYPEWDAGREDYSIGKDIDENPYPAGTPENQLWNEGWSYESSLNDQGISFDKPE